MNNFKIRGKNIKVSNINPNLVGADTVVDLDEETCKIYFYYF
jgi:hypothetical protein